MLVWAPGLHPSSTGEVELMSDFVSLTLDLVIFKLHCIFSYWPGYIGILVTVICH